MAILHLSAAIFLPDATPTKHGLPRQPQTRYNRGLGNRHIP